MKDQESNLIWEAYKSKKSKQQDLPLTGEKNPPAKPKEPTADERAGLGQGRWQKKKVTESGHVPRKKTDAELVDIAHQVGVEEVIVLDGEGFLANREEVVEAIKDVELERDKAESRAWPDDPRGPINQ